MLSNLLANFYERDLRRLIEEVDLFKNEGDLWKTQGTVKNASGNIVLHIIGGLNYLIGTNLAHTGYVRNRDQEFTMKGVERAVLVAGLEELIPMIKQTLGVLGQEGMEVEFPIIFDDMRVPNSYVLVQLLAHLNYHLGQVNYLRRVL